MTLKKQIIPLNDIEASDWTGSVISVENGILHLQYDVVEPQARHLAFKYNWKTVKQLTETCQNYILLKTFCFSKNLKETNADI